MHAILMQIMMAFQTALIIAHWLPIRDKKIQIVKEGISRV